MKANLVGKVLEKFTRDVKTPSGTKEERMYLRLYQEGERMNVDVQVKADTYSTVTSGQTIELENITLTSYKDVIYARQ